MFVDSHCHIFDIKHAVVAREAGVVALLNAGNDFDDSEKQLEMCQIAAQMREDGFLLPYIYTSVGVHPENALSKLDKVHVDDLICAADNPFVVAIGECGLDYHYGKDSKETQKEVFFYHIEAAAKTGLPLMIHQREAEEDMLSLLDEGQKKFGQLTGVIHCFSSNADFAYEVNKRGFYISASGIITFNNAKDLRDIFALHPLEKILIETDSPYLAPVPFRGKENAPVNVVKVAEKLAEIRGEDVAKIGRITTENFYRLYQKKIGKFDITTLENDIV